MQQQRLSRGLYYLFVSILTGLERPVQLENTVVGYRRISWMSILTGLERPVQQEVLMIALHSAWVSILTGLEKPVQLIDRALAILITLVSILTGLERPVQPGRGRGHRPGLPGFNPHRP